MMGGGGGSTAYSRNFPVSFYFSLSFFFFFCKDGYWSVNEAFLPRLLEFFFSYVRAVPVGRGAGGGGEGVGMEDDRTSIT